MANNLSGFIPEIWSRKTSKILDKNTVMLQLVNKNYEGEIKGAGSNVQIRTYGDVTVKNYAGSISYDSLTSPSQSLPIDQKKYFAFKVDDVEKAQSDINIMDGYMKRAKVAVAETIDTSLLSLYADVQSANQVTGGAFTKDTVYGYVCDVRTALEDADALRPGEMGWLVVNPTIHNLIRKSPEFTQASALGEKTIKSGKVGEMAGLEIYCTTNLSAVSGTTYCLAGTNDAITYAGQVTKIRMKELEGAFEQAASGLYVFGRKVIVPGALAYLTYTP